MLRQFLHLLALAIGAILMYAALCFSLTTFAHGGYRSALLLALACSILSLLSLTFPLFRGPPLCRITALFLAAPALFVWYDFLQRFHL